MISEARTADDFAGRMGEFEGLVISTARRYAKQVHREEDDLAQELRMKVWHLLQRYDSGRSRLSLQAYVFGGITNRVKDMKRDASREVNRRQRHGIEFRYTEDFAADGEQFDALYSSVDHDEVYGGVDEGLFVLPSTVTERETRILLLLMSDWSKAETALRLGLTRCQLDTVISRLRRKLADWSPGGQPADASQTVASVELALATAA